jgi:hypothetical protein
MKWDKSLGLKDLFINLNLKKSFDRVEWTLILAMLHALKFGPLFVQVVETIFVDASA